MLNKNEFQHVKTHKIFQLEPPTYNEDFENDYMSLQKIFTSNINTNFDFSNRPKSLRNWKSCHIMSWIIDLYNEAGINYNPINIHLLKNCTGTDLTRLTENYFEKIDSENSKWLFQNIQELISQIDAKEEITRVKKRGRPPLGNKNRKKTERKTGKLWEFIRDLLLDHKYCPDIVRWVNHEEGTFKFVNSDQVAKIWGMKRGNKNMTYEKLSRAMRYYYKGKIFEAVREKRLVYRFGPNAKDWRTSNPNFEKTN